MNSKMLMMRWVLGLPLMLMVLALEAQSSGKYIKRMEQDSFTLYFATPVEMKADQARVVFEPDFTYHAYEETPTRDQVTMNFSLFTKKDPVKELDRIVMQAGNDTFNTSEVEFLYLERDGKKWHSRFTANVPVEAYQALLKESESAVFNLSSRERDLVFPSNRKWRKSAEIVREYLANQ